MHVLLIEHDPTSIELWSQRLQPLDVALTTASSLESACIQVDQIHFALVLCCIPVEQPGPLADSQDNMNPLVQKIRTRSVYTVSVVDRLNHPMIRSAFSSGFEDCLHEDCSAEELRAKVDHARKLKQAEERLAQAQKLESIGELAAGIAHEINTPIQYVGDNTRFVQSACNDLIAILATCEQLVATAQKEGHCLQDLDDAAGQLHAAMQAADTEYLVDEIPAAIDQTLDGVTRVSNIVRAMKEFAHPGATEMTLTDLSKSIENTVMVARNEWKYVADMVTHFSPDLPAVPCLPGEFNQVLLNLIVNAAHAIGDSLGDSPEKKGTITVETRLAKPFAEVRISDTGCGIPPENIARIFTPFFTTKAAGKGTGQGLAIAHSVVVEKHNGTINVESQPGRGTTFVIRLPLEQSTKQTIAKSAQATPEKSTQSWVH
ncbi:hybrid sensor histidine kinase/response regulator [Stieleria varia]|uniref:histidine kinase n=1 Tax=Stieleria varia TaxID=2528005 RepID=A0A5C5ZTE6_9BACT|nr:ATP-binding protein [Stieleria varia]TWT89473.1 Sensor protein ZraS [Stieleria varia]